MKILEIIRVFKNVIYFQTWFLKTGDCQNISYVFSEIYFLSKKLLKVYFLNSRGSWCDKGRAYDASRKAAKQTWSTIHPRWETNSWGEYSCILFALFKHYLHNPDSLITYLIEKNIVCNTYINIQHIQVIRLYISHH